MSGVVANQVDPPAAEIGQEYETFNEGVIAPRGTQMRAAPLRRQRRAKPLPPHAFGAIMKG
jgi:hypothetical protein